MIGLGGSSKEERGPGGHTVLWAIGLDPPPKLFEPGDAGPELPRAEGLMSAAALQLMGEPVLCLLLREGLFPAAS